MPQTMDGIVPWQPCLFCPLFKHFLNCTSTHLFLQAGRKDILTLICAAVQIFVQVLLLRLNWIWLTVVFGIKLAGVLPSQWDFSSLFSCRFMMRTRSIPGSEWKRSNNRRISRGWNSENKKRGGWYPPLCQRGRRDFPPWRDNCRTC